MLRTLVAVVVAGALTVALSACSGSDSEATPAPTQTETLPTNATIVLRGRKGSEGPWQHSLRLQLDRNDITSFSVCAVVDQPSPPAICRPAAVPRLPRATTLRLEQRRGDGDWTVVGTSRNTALEAVLSNTVSGNQPGAVSHRVTLRHLGQVLATSNTFDVYWVP